MTPQEENARLQQLVNQELAAFNDAQKDATDKTKKRAETEAKIEQVTGAVIQAFDKLYNAQLKYDLSIAKGSKGAATFNDSIDAMTDATQAAAVALSLLVPGGALVKGVVAAFTYLATTAMKTAAEWQKLANEQADATYKAFQAFSKAGATGADGLKGFFDDVNRMRLNVHQMDAMAAAVANNAKEMAAMGGTVYKGRKQFADLVQNMKPFEKGMLNLGMSYDDQAEAALGYMKIQSQLTLGQQRDYGKQSAAARKYVEDTEALIRVTGLNRKQQEDILERQMSQQRSGARLQELMDQDKGDAVKLLQDQAKIYAKMGPVAEQGYNDILSGFVNTEAAQKLFMATQGKVMQDQNDIIEGRVKTEREAMEATEATAGVMGDMRKQFGGLFRVGAGEDLLLPFKELGEAAKLKAQGLADAIDDSRTEVDKLTGTVDGVDTQLDRFTNLLMKQNNKMLVDQQKLNGAFSDTTGAAEAVSEYMKKLMKSLEPTVEFLMKLGVIVLPGLLGTVDLLVAAFNVVAKLLTGDFVGAFNDTIDGVWKFAKGWGDTIELLIKGLYDIIDGFAKQLERGVKSLFAPLITIFDDLGDTMSGFGDSVKNGLTKFSDALVNMVSDLWNKLKSMIPGLDTVTNAASNVSNFASGAASSAGDYVSSLFGGSSAPPAPPAPAVSNASATASRGSSTAAGGGKGRSGGPSMTTVSAPAAGPGELGGKPPADKPLPPRSGDTEQSGSEVRIGNEIRKGGTVSWRTNNPGNVSYGGLSKQYGAIGAWKNPNGDQQQRTTGIAIFPTMEAGEKMKIDQWLRPKYIDKTIDQGAMQWAEGANQEGPGSKYARALAQAAGATLDTVIGQLSQSQLKSMVTKQSQLEGFREGQIIQAANGGVFDGPKSGYSATLHGMEAVIPLKDGAVPVSMNQEFNMTATNLGELVNQMRSNMAMQDRMVTVLEEIRRIQSATADNTSRMAAYAAN